VINVLRDWYNSAEVIGVTGPSCAGFKITNDSYNSGTVIFADLCDLNTPGTINGNSGTLTMVTYCSCNNFCQEITSVEETQAEPAFSIYPNPATDKIAVQIENNFSGTAQLKTIGGKIIAVKNFDSGKFEISLSGLSKGIYMLTLYAESGAFLGAKLVNIAD